MSESSDKGKRDRIWKRRDIVTNSDQMSELSNKGKRGMAESIRQTLEAAGYRIDIAKIMAIIDREIARREGDL